MKATALEPSGGREWIVLVVALVFSIAGHVAVMYGVAQIPPRETEKPVWVEMVVAVNEPPPPPPPEVKEVEPEEPKEPEKPKPPPDPVDLKEIPPPPPPDAPPPPPEARKVRKLAQGINANSFAAGAGTGLAVNAGTTTSMKDDGTRMGLDEATEFATVPYTSVAKPPKLKNNPMLEVPQEVIDAEIEGRVELELTLSPEGEVTGWEVVAKLHPAADQACIAHARRTVWSPYEQDGVAAAVKGVPFSCRFEKIED